MTSRFHDTAGVVVFAYTLDTARFIIEKQSLSSLDNSYRDGTKILSRDNIPDPDEVYNVESSKERIYVFPNAGCC